MANKAPNAKNAEAQNASPSPSPAAGNVEFSENFRNWMKEYIEKDNRSIELKSQLDEIKERKKELKDNILKYMKDNEINVFNTPQAGVFRRKQVKKTKGLNKVFISECLEKSNKLKDDADVDEIVKYIYDCRPTEEVEELDRKKS
jgi:hypothetical protein